MNREPFRVSGSFLRGRQSVASLRQTTAPFGRGAQNSVDYIHLYTVILLNTLGTSTDVMLCTFRMAVLVIPLMSPRLDAQVVPSSTCSAD